MADAAIACSNIGMKGRKFRRRQGLATLAIASVWFLAAVLAGASLVWRMLPGLLVASGTVTLLQAVRSVCVLRAAQGTIEHEDMSLTKADDALTIEAKRVASGILRDGILAGLAVAALGYATTLVH